MNDDQLEEWLSELEEMGFGYAVVVHSCLDESEILHMVGYQSTPSRADLNSLIQELATDEEFELTDLVFSKDYNFKLMERK